MNIFSIIKTENWKKLIISESIRFLIILLLFIFLYISNSSFNLFKSTFHDLMKNWRIFPITDIKIAKSNECQQGYKSLIEEKWAGTNHGCNCIFSLNQGSCNEHELTCSNVYPRKEIPLKKWESVHLCAKHSDKNYFNYFDNIPYKRNGDCSNGYKFCGTLDSVGNSICVLEDEQCPINDIKVVNQSTFDSIRTRKNYSFITLAHDKILIFRSEDFKLNVSKSITSFNEYSNEVSQVVINLKISEGKNCLNPGEINTNYSQYILDKNRDNYRCGTHLDNIYYDDRYKFIDSSLKYDLYKENDLLKVIYNLPKYPLGSLNATLNLYFREYIGIKNFCFNDQYFSPKNFKINYLILTNIFLVHDVLVIILGVLMFFIIIAKYIEFRLDNILGWKFNLFVETTISISLFLLLIFLLINTKKIYSINDLIVNFKLMNCGDNILNLVFIELGNKLDSLIQIYIISILISLLVVFLIPVTYFGIYLMKYKSNNQEEMDKLASS